MKAALAALLLLGAMSCKKETESVQPSGVSSENSVQQNKLASVRIGTQVWMVKNLDVSHYRNGDTIPEVKDRVKWAKLTTGAWCWYNNSSDSGAVYGKLYNWYAVHDPRGLAPEGWHIPSDSEWRATETLLGGTTGGKMKETGTAHWTDPNVDATNSTGLTGLPGGYRSFTGQYCYIHYLGLWWTSTEYDTKNAWYRRMLCYSNFLDWWRFPKTMGFSVRCIKN
jgi:uncharacterized protein (TIGR02145 family)